MAAAVADAQTIGGTTPGGVIDPEPERPAAVQALEAAPAASFEDQVMEIVNERRNDAGKPPLKRNTLLDASSSEHSTNMATRDFFAHCDPDTGNSPFDRITNAGYIWNSAGENIAAGFSTPDAVMTAWMGSSGHRANIESSSFREIGIGYFQAASDKGNVRRDQNADCVPDAIGGPYFRYWTQNFGRRRNVYPVIINGEAYLTDSRDVNLYVYGSGFAQDMRFRNEDGAWSAWEPHQDNKAWQLSAGDGGKTVNGETRSAAGSVLSTLDTIILELLCSALHDVLNLTAQTMSTMELLEACTLITAGDDLIIGETAEVTLRAPRVLLQPGFAIRAGARFQVQSVTPGS